MADKPDEPKQKVRDPDERVSIPLDPEKALAGLLKVDPESESVELNDEERGRGLRKDADNPKLNRE